MKTLNEKLQEFGKGRFVYTFAEEIGINTKSDILTDNDAWDRNERYNKLFTKAEKLEIINNLILDAINGKLVRSIRYENIATKTIYSAKDVKAILIDIFNKIYITTY